MKEEGIVGHVGLGCRPQHFHRRAIETGRLEIVLTFLDYNLMNQSAAATTLPLARERGVGVILASALGLGRLTGVEPDRRAEPLAHRMWEWCRERGVNIRHLSMQFCLAADIEGIVLAGPKDRKEVDDAIEAATVEVPPGVWAEFKAEFGVGAVGFPEGAEAAPVLPVSGRGIGLNPATRGCTPPPRGRRSP